MNINLCWHICVYCDVDATSIYLLPSQRIPNSMVLNIFQNKTSHSKASFEKKCFAERKAAQSVGSKNETDIQTHNMSFPIKYLLREHKSFALYSLSAGSSQITNNFSFIFLDLFTEKLFYEPRFSDWQSYWMIRKVCRI